MKKLRSKRKSKKSRERTQNTTMPESPYMLKDSLVPEVFSPRTDFFDIQELRRKEVGFPPLTFPYLLSTMPVLSGEATLTPNSLITSLNRSRRRRTEVLTPI